MLYDGRYKLVLSTERDAMLFDLETDPEESVDVAAENAVLVEALTAMLLDEIGEDWQFRYASVPANLPSTSR